MKLLDQKAARSTFPIALVVSRFNSEVTTRLLEGALMELKERQFAEDDILVAWVPGAVEISLIAQRVAQQGKYDAILALGAVIRGETSHYDYVCSQVSQGCQRVSLEFDIPVIFGVLTTENEEQAMARAGGAMGNKGKEAVEAAVEMVELLRKID